MEVLTHNNNTFNLIQGDCIEKMREMHDKSIDLLLTDPPYGVNYKYNMYDDTKEHLKSLVDSFMPVAMRVAKRIAVTCGNGNQHLYPPRLDNGLGHYSRGRTEQVGIYMLAAHFSIWQMPI